jgi:hypothetical protein
MQTMIVNIENNIDIRAIFDVVSKLKGVAEVRIENSEASFISGLSYTSAERLKDICRSEEEYKMGKTLSSEELKKRVSLWK